MRSCGRSVSMDMTVTPAIRPPQSAAPQRNTGLMIPMLTQSPAVSICRLLYIWQATTTSTTAAAA